MKIPLEKLRHVCRNYESLWLYVGFEVAARHRSDAGLGVVDYKPFFTTPPTKEWMLDKTKDYGATIKQTRHAGKFGHGTRIVR